MHVATAGGGRVLFPAGRYLSGSLRLRSGVELHLEKGSRLIGVKDLDAYQGFESGDWGKSRWNRGLIVGEGLERIAFTGVWSDRWQPGLRSERRSGHARPAHDSACPIAAM